MGHHHFKPFSSPNKETGVPIVDTRVVDLPVQTDGQLPHFFGGGGVGGMEGLRFQGSFEEKQPGPARPPAPPPSVIYYAPAFCFTERRRYARPRAFPSRGIPRCRRRKDGFGGN